MPEQVDVLHEFESGRGTIRATVSTFRGVRRADIRVWVEPRDEPGAPLIPTTKGVNVELSDLDELQQCLDALRRAAALEPAGRHGVRSRRRPDRELPEEEAPS